MIGSDLIFCGLFVAGIVVSVTADFRLRRTGAGSWLTGCITAVGPVLVFIACAAAIR